MSGVAESFQDFEANFLKSASKCLIRKVITASLIMIASLIYFLSEDIWPSKLEIIIF